MGKEGFAELENFREEHLKELQSGVKENVSK
jgi:hypothetical protein